MNKKILLTLMQLVLTLALYGTGILIIGIALYPSVGLVYHVWASGIGLDGRQQILRLSLAFAVGYFTFGLVLTFFVGAVRTILGIRLKEGEHKIGSLGMVAWMFYNALFLLVRTIFMDFLLLTPLVSLFYRFMGAKLGANVQINSKNVADHPLLEIGDDAVIGGNATVICHSFERQGLRLQKVKIGKGAIIGLNAVILPGVVIGEYAVIAAGAVVPKGTKIEAGTVYYGSLRDKKE